NADKVALHLLNRLTFGPKPGEVEWVKKLGAERFIQMELSPENIPESSTLQSHLNGLKTYALSNRTLFEKFSPKGQQNFQRSQRKGAPPQLDQEAKKALLKASHQVLLESCQANLMRSIESNRQLEAVMTDFWFNHFNVYGGKGLDTLWVGDYEKNAIHPHALGNFRTLLGATSKHPAMLFYLDNWENTDPNSPGSRGRFKGLNENYARELMELHTLGVDGGYTQQDVITLAKVLTGWGIINRQALLGQHFKKIQSNAPNDLFYFDAQRHDFSSKVFLGHPLKGQGAEEVEEALDILARNPATAKHIAFQLVQYFVNDSPPPELVNQVASKYSETGGNIKAMLNTLFHSKEFWNTSNIGNKFKSPYRYVVSSTRASGLQVENYLILTYLLKQMGMPVYGCLTPDGYKNTQEAWLNPDTIQKRLNIATALGKGGIPLSENMEIPGNFTNDKKRNILNGGFRREGGRQTIGTPLIYNKIAGNFQSVLSPKTKEVIQDSSEDLKVTLLLGSPEFMKY
ncbi:MAG: DUF1800 domain-containing protein, partial [Cyanobacteria bacterium]|nr:DUF1800 domain-containing protein [Cyanobacteriota bacterium]